MNKQYRDLFNNWFKEEFKHMPDEDLNIAIHDANVFIDIADVIKTPAERLQEDIRKYHEYKNKQK